MDLDTANSSQIAVHTEWHWEYTGKRDRHGEGAPARQQPTPKKRPRRRLRANRHRERDRKRGFQANRHRERDGKEDSRRIDTERETEKKIPGKSTPRERPKRKSTSCQELIVIVIFLQTYCNNC